jgi:hypothetical protein
MIPSPMTATLLMMVLFLKSGLLRDWGGCQSQYVRASWQQS